MNTDNNVVRACGDGGGAGAGWRDSMGKMGKILSTTNINGKKN